jgi:hypothetical protein
VAAPAWPGPPPSSSPVAWRPLARPLTTVARFADRVATGLDAPHTSLLDQPRQRRRSHTVETPLAFASADGPLPGATPSASSILAWLCPRGAVFRREPALPRAGEDRRDADFVAADRGLHLPRTGAAAARSAGGEPTRERSAGTRRPPASDRLRGALEPLELAHHGPQLADAGVELRADAIEQIRHQRRHSSNGSGPRRGAETLSGTAAPGDGRDMIPSRHHLSWAARARCERGTRRDSKPQTPGPRPRAPNPGQQPQTIGGDPSSGYDLLGVYPASTPEHNPGLRARDRRVRDIHHFHGFRVLEPPRCAAVRSSVHDS